MEPYPTYAWPGGYPFFYITQDSGVLCPKCANANLALCQGDDPQWKVVAQEVNWENEALYCDNCYKIIESAYGGEE